MRNPTVCCDLNSLAAALTRTRHGIALREAGQVSAAEAIFTALTQDFPAKAYGWQELGVLHAQTGNSTKALEHFRRAIEIEPHDVLPRHHCALHLLAMGRPAEGDAVLAAHPQTDCDAKRRICVLRQFLRFLQEWSEMRALATANGYEESERFTRVANVELEIFAAIEAKRPFSLIRIGDGEGSLLPAGEPAERHYHDLFESNRREFIRLWFGSHELVGNPAFRALAGLLVEAMRNATFIGMPYSLRVAYEYRIRSVRGIPSIANILRWYEHELGGTGSRLCSQDIHLELQDSGFYGRLLSGGRDLALVTCHPTLPDLITLRTGARVIEMHLVPEEKGFTDVIGFNGISEAHFPSVYGRVVDSIRRARCPGLVWLVAAGYLGKIYCEEIRCSGGIALDIGSVVDGWLGKVTRPTLHDLDRFRL